ncbi:MAG: hypothetical protein ACOWW1_08745 [archaeon]|nr:hypothetical protein [Candidatus Bathyarchaeum sp.]
MIANTVDRDKPEEVKEHLANKKRKDSYIEGLRHENSNSNWGE